jgi:uncharacterized protein (DUF2062 family)
MILSPASLVKFWRERVVALVMAQLMQGVTPQKIALSIALGLSLGIIPILGITTMLCAVAAIRFRLNQPVIQLVNWLVYPLQLGLFLVFARIGEWMLHAPIVNLSLPELLLKFHESPMKFFEQFGAIILQGFVAWLFIAPVLTGIIYSVLAGPLKRLVELKASVARASDSE